MRILAAFILVALSCAAADTGRLKLEVNPGRAGVFIDGKYVGPAANFKVGQTYQVVPGEHEIKLEDPRYQEIVKKVTIEAGKKTVMKETMMALPPAKPPFGKLRIENAVAQSGQLRSEGGAYEWRSRHQDGDNRSGKDRYF